MCGRASDVIYQLALDSMQDCCHFNPESEPADSLTTLTQCFQNSLLPRNSFYDPDPQFISSQSGSDICIEVTPVINIQDMTSQQYTLAKSQCPFCELNERTVLHQDEIYQNNFVTENYSPIAVPAVPRIELLETEVSHGNPLSCSPSSSGGPERRTLGSPLQMENRSPAQECYVLWKSVPAEAIVVTGTNKYVPQKLYKPHTETDRERYLEQVSLLTPIIFMTKEPFEWGISLEDVCNGKTQRLVDKDVPVLEDCGPSISIRINWPGYPSFKRQISSRNWRKIKGPTTKKKLAENLAKTTGRFIEKMSNKPLEAGTEANWKVGPRYIKVEDLILVSLHHVSKGSWQPQFRLRYDVA